jgi:hypothetical protein
MGTCTGQSTLAGPSYSDIPAFDIAILVERQLRKHEHMEIAH